jgi:SnoaL-like protein
MDVPPVLRQLHDAMRAHDLGRLTACFAAGYRNETPVHPSRGFTGRDQVRANWRRILGEVPDLEADLVRWASTPAQREDAVWAEWEWTGHRADGVGFCMRGVTVFGIGPDDAAPGPDLIRWARFYMEPADPEEIGVTEAVRRAVGGVR